MSSRPVHAQLKGMATMNAAFQLTYGPPNVVGLTAGPRPTPGELDVLVRVRASAVTQADRRLRAGDFPGVTWLPGRLALGLTGPRRPVPGTSFAGVVEAVGSGVRQWSVGDAVFGSVLHGAHAELLVVPEDGPLARTPSGLGHEEAAALPYGAVTALAFLREIGDVRPGQHVAILGASGGVGRFAVQIAKHLGAEVTAVCSRRHHDLVRSLGADHVVDYRSEALRAHPRPFDVILDTVGALRFDRSRHLLAPRGRYLGLLVSVRLLVQMLGTALFGGQRAIAGIAAVTHQRLDDVRALVEAGALRPLVGRTFSFDDIARAHECLERGDGAGTVVVTIPAGAGGDRR